jgi:hypothetical protein
MIKSSKNQYQQKFYYSRKGQEYYKQYRKTEKFKSVQKKYRQSVVGKKWRIDNKEKLDNYHRKYYLSHPEYLHKHNEKGRLAWQKLKLLVFTYYFGEKVKCIKCGIKDLRILQLHHYEGGGAKHRKKVTGTAYGGGSKFYWWIKKAGFPKIKLQPVCANCHILIRYETPTSKSVPNWLKRVEDNDSKRGRVRNKKV